ncbi:MAG: protein kinase [Candidatus Solibacter usitatus]|nr:protein kinase [Candidatus Solibacter usitatus]
MTVGPGTTLGPYEILSLLGEGGMGSVYKARDPRLGRYVAIKVAKEKFNERFDREARAVAALNHNNICTLYDIGPNYLVMEYIEGPTLTARIKEGAMSVDAAMPILKQLVDGIEAAHEKNIYHRDLKPDNIKITPEGVVKILDFGLAKAADPITVVDDPANAPTLRLMTVAGAIMGTPSYMSPEQASGKPVDKRADIWAFGVVVWEMLTQSRLFGGETIAHTMAEVLTKEFTLDGTPEVIRPLLSRCLVRDAKVRMRDIGEARIALNRIAAGGQETAATPAQYPKRRERLSWALAAIATAAALTLGLFYFRKTAPPIYPVRFDHPLPQKNTLTYMDTPAASPDGRMFAYTGVKSGVSPMLWLRRIEAAQAVALQGTENAAAPFWSPDSRFIGFYADGKLKKIDVNGGPPQILCDPRVFLGGSWNRDGVILIGGTRLSQVSSAGGEPKRVFERDDARRETGQFWPHFLPDGRHFLYTSRSQDASKSGVYLGSLGSQESRRLLDSYTNASFVEPDLLLFARGIVLFAQSFDTGKLQLRGEPFPVADAVTRNDIGGVSSYSSSRNGTLVYRAGNAAGAEIQPAWYDRNGKRLGSAGEPRVYRQGMLSPDEKRFAAQILDPKVGTSDIWILDLTSVILSRVTSDPAAKDTVAWSPDGREILFGSSSGGFVNLYRKMAGGGDARPVHALQENVYPAEWLKDGSITFLNRFGRNFYRLASGAGAKPETLLKTEYNKDGLRVSPDGRWAAYNTNESGRHEVYIAAFPSFAERRQVSSAGGVQGYWRKDGKELFYLTLEGNMMSVPIKNGVALEAGIPNLLFPTRVPVEYQYDQFAVTGDGKRFLLLESIDSEAKPITVVVNWPAVLKR